MATVAMPPEKLPMDTAAVYVGDTENMQIDDKRWRINRVAIYSCVIVVMTLILVVGTLAAISIVLKHRAGTSSQVAMTAGAREPAHRDALLDTSNDAWVPDDDGQDGISNGVDINPRIKIDNGGLMPPTVDPVLVKPDLVAVDYTDDVVIAINENDIIKIDDDDEDRDENDDGESGGESGSGSVTSDGEISSGDGERTEDPGEDDGSGVSAYSSSLSSSSSSDGMDHDSSSGYFSKY